MRILSFAFSGLTMICYIGLGLLFLYCQWLLVTDNFFNFINPLAYLMALWNMLFIPLTWVLLVIGAVSFFASLGVESLKKKDHVDY
jgi:hypothetical protein